MHTAAAENAEAHAILLGMIYVHGLADQLSLHLVHKHFDLLEGRVMVYETFEGRHHPGFVLSSPRVPAKCNNLRGLYFQARPLGKMVAYKYTTAPGVDLSGHVHFVAKFAKMVIQLGAENVFALSVKVPAQGLFTEFELPDSGSTILVRGAPTWLLEEGTQSTSTDWMATQHYSKYASGPGSVPGIVQLSCSTTRSGKHY